MKANKRRLKTWQRKTLAVVLSLFVSLVVGAIVLVAATLTYAVVEIAIAGYRIPVPDFPFRGGLFQGWGDLIVLALAGVSALLTFFVACKVFKDLLANPKEKLP